MLKLIIIVSMIIFCSAFSSALVKDVSIEILIPSQLNESELISNLFLLKNNDDAPGNDNLTVGVNYSFNNASYYYIKTINSYSKSGMGELFFSKENNSLCVNATALNFIDNNSINNFACKNISILNSSLQINTTVNDTINITINDTINLTQNITNTSLCNYYLDIKTNKDIYIQGESIKFVLDSNISSTLEYWVDDLFNRTSKSHINTTSLSEKTFTPKFDGEEKSFIIKAKDFECDLYAEKIVHFKNNGFISASTFIDVSTPESVEFNEIFFVLLEGYKEATSQTLISIWVEGSKGKISEVTKTYILNQQTDFKQRVPVIFKENFKGSNFKLIVEGLGENIQKDIDVIYEEEENIKEIKTNTIKSFYTRKKLFSENITVFITLDDALEGSLLVETSKGKFLKFGNGKSFSINITIASYDEIISANLLDSNGEILDKRDLILSLTPPTIKEDIQELSPPAPIVKNESPQITSFVTAPEVESENDNSNFLIIGVALIGILLLFRREILKIFSKKTKIFK